MKTPCEHGHYDEHEYLTPGGHPESSVAYRDCPGGVRLDVDVEALRGAVNVLADGYALREMTRHNAADFPPAIAELSQLARQVLSAFGGLPQGGNDVEATE